MSAAILLSGGMDSIALTFWKRPSFAYTFDYGQLSAEGEILAAAAVCKHLGICHRVTRIDCAELGSGDMAGRKPSDQAPVPEWWPFRNQLLATLGGALALKDRVDEMLFGSVKTDGTHADGRAEFFRLLSDVMRFQEGSIRISAPAIHIDSVELIKKANVPLSVLAWSHSCHVNVVACGSCRGCVKHARTMLMLGHCDY